MGLDDYRLTVQLDAGRDGVRYRAERRSDGAAVEVVRLDPLQDDPLRRAELHRRSILCGSLRHPIIRPILEADFTCDPAYLVFPASGPPTLAEIVAVEGVMAAPVALEILDAVASALAAIHRLGFVHGRLDPRAVRGRVRGELSLDVSGVEAQADRPGGSIIADHFQAPELLPGAAATPESDVFSLGGLGRWLWWGTSRTGQPFEEIADLLESLCATDPFERPSAVQASSHIGVLLALGAQSIVASPAGATSEWSSDSKLPGEERGLYFDLKLSGGDAAAPASVAVRAETMPARLGRYRIVSRLGAGGMGEVFKAVDEADGRVVAVKVLRPNHAGRASALKRFRKEARLLARVRNPYVTNLLDVNEDQGLHYIVLEYVDGESLEQALAARGRLDEPTALAIAADVARGLMDAHRLGIVHRDVKPANILVIGALGAVGDGPRVKLSDFGLARQEFEAGSQVVTQAGVVVGTPSYMAPEQCSGGSIDARTDIYALGATLFHLLAGRPPFEADDWRLVIARHQNEPPPPLRSLNAAVSEGLARVVERTLAKAPDARYVDAEALLADLERLLRGEPTGLPVHPALPDADGAYVQAFEFSWDLDASPSALWPYVANTDRVDRALGFGAVRYTLKLDPAVGLRRFLEGRKAGQVEEGEEQPYEWVEGRRLGILREYSRGPFVWVVSVVELTARAGGGTTLTHRLRLEPRGRLMRLGSRWGVGSRLKNDLARVYRRIDSALTGRLGGNPLVDPFEPAAELSAPRGLRLVGLLQALKAKGVSERIVAALGAFLTEAPAPELSRIRPIALARRLGLDEDAVVVACLHAAHVGLLVLLWDLLCPVCRIPSEVKETLRAIADHGHCEACQADFALDFAASVELVFRSHPQVREADTNTYCAAGPAHSPHVVAQLRLAAGERLELDLTLREGAYRLRGPQLGWAFDFRVAPGAPSRRWELSLSSGPIDGLSPTLGTGTQTLGLGNDTDRPLVVRVERVAARDDALTAARASTLAVFRELFPAEVLAPGRLVSISDVTLLMTDLDSPGTSLYTELGDARAFAVLAEQYLLIDAAVRLAGGAIVKSIGEGVVAAFCTPEAALEAGLAIARDMAATASTRALAPRLRLAAHRGPAMAATLNDDLDYFGATVHEARSALRFTPSGAFTVTRAVAADPQVAARLSALGRAVEVVAGLADDCVFGPLLRLSALAAS